VSHECEQLWFVDVGILEPGGGERLFALYWKIQLKSHFIKTIANPKYVQQPSIWTIDLKTDKVLNRYEIPQSIARDGSGMASITIDAINCSSNDVFAYIPDLTLSQIIVFSLRENKAWRVQHNYFRMNPFEGFYNVDGLKFAWDDAIFSITLGKREKDSFRVAFFHPMSRLVNGKRGNSQRVARFA